MRCHLVQLNVATLRWPIDDTRVADFVDALPTVNRLGEQSPGFVWRLQSDSGDATDIRLFDDPRVIVNMTVWESLEHRRAFAYRGLHRDFFRRRSEWFEAHTSRTALWWIAAGTLPVAGDISGRLAFIDAFGASPYAFEIGQPQAALAIVRVGLDDDRAQRLIAGLNAELTATYPEPGRTFFRLDPAEVTDDRGCFVLAELDDIAVACGEYRRVDESTAEIKRMFVAPSARGHKVGAAVVAELEARARRDGVRRLVLETATRQDAALGLYEKVGFHRCDCWGDYRRSPSSVCMEKPLGHGPASEGQPDAV